MQELSHGLRLTVIEDGAAVFGPEIFPSVTNDRRAALLAAAGASEVRTQFNCYLLEQAGELTLVDCGAGGLFGPIAGRLGGTLSALGIAPAQITRLILTHLHTDHCGGALTSEGSRVFPQAEVILHRDELNRWDGADHFAARFIEAYRDRLRLVDDGAEIAPSVTVWALPGHSPGHIGLRLSETAAIVGDVVHGEVLQLADPSISPIYDEDPVRAEVSRRLALGEAADRGLLIAGGHLLGGIAKIARDGDGFRRVDL